MDHDQVGGSVAGSTGASVELDYVYARQLVHAYFVMLTVGCKRDDCTNGNCRSNAQSPQLTATEAVIKSVYFATQAPAPLCVDLDQKHEELLLTSETPQLPSTIEAQQQELESTPEQQQAIEENQSEDDLAPTDEDQQQSKHELHPETPEADVMVTQQPEQITTTDQHQHSKEELHPETSEAEVPKFQQPEIITTESSATAETPARKSTPRRRLSVAMKLDNGLNKGRESPVKRPTIITRVAVQPKHKLAINPATSLANGVPDTTTNATTGELEKLAEQQQEQAASKPASPAQDVRQRRLSRPKEKLFDAIKRSFSRTKKAPLGSA